MLVITTLTSFIMPLSYECSSHAMNKAFESVFHKLSWGPKEWQTFRTLVNLGKSSFVHKQSTIFTATSASLHHNLNAFRLNNRLSFINFGSLKLKQCIYKIMSCEPDLFECLIFENISHYSLQWVYLNFGMFWGGSKIQQLKII